MHRPRPAVNLILFLVTLVSTAYWGFLEYQGFYREDLPFLTLNPMRAPEAFVGGLPFAAAVLAFLLAHEMGHYLACRYYGIAATLPYFIPIPPPFNLLFSLLPGTMGAVIRIVSPITSRRALFDIAVAGPLAGFAVALPILAVGLSQSRVLTIVELEAPGALPIGEPLIWGPMSELFSPASNPGQELLVHPLAYVGWFALLVTAMNLLPVGQLDGGHLLYALWPRRHRTISTLVLGLMLVAGVLYFPGWIIFAAVIAFAMGLRHPRPQGMNQELGRGRILLALVAAAVFAGSFMIAPIPIPLPWR